MHQTRFESILTRFEFNGNYPLIISEVFIKLKIIASRSGPR